MNVTLEKKDDLNAILSIEIKPEDYKPGVTQSLKDYRKTAKVPGFRPGLAPMGMIKKMVGKSIFVEEVNKIANNALFSYLREQKIDILGQPINSEEKESEANFDEEGDFLFHFDLGLTPQFELNFTSKDKVTRHKLIVDDKEVDKEVENLCRRYGSLEKIDVTEVDKDSLSGTLTELDDKGNPLDGGVSDQTSTVLIEMVKDKKEQKKLIGVKVGDSVDVDIFKLFNGNEKVVASTVGLPAEGVKDLNKNFRFDITEVKRFIASEVNQSLFDKVFGENIVSSEEEFKDKLKGNLETYYASEAENHVDHEVQHLVVDKHDLALPDEFLKRWLQQTYPDTYTPENTEDNYVKESNGLRAQLVREKVLEQHEAKLTEEDINQASYGYTAQMLRQYGMSNPDLPTIQQFEQQNRSDQNYMNQVRDIAVNQKVTQLVKGMISVKEKEVSVEKFYDMIQKHNEKHNH